MKDPYKVLGVSPSATDEEVKSAYRALARKYHPDNYDANNPLADLATEKMKEINEAYDEIQKMRKNGERGYYGGGKNYDYTSGQDTGTIYFDIRQKINAGRFNEAEQMLESIPEQDRTADYHFLKAVCLYRRRFVSDAMRELEIACSMDPGNTEYQQAKRMFNDRSDVFGRTYYGAGHQQAGSGCDLCELCSTLYCLQCLCRGGMGGC